MKRKIFYILLMFTMFFSSCKEDEIISSSYVNIEVLEMEVEYTTARILWSVSTDATINDVHLEYAKDTTFTNSAEAPMTSINKSNLYHVMLDSLKDGTKYYIRCKVINKYNSLTSDIKDFTTKKYRLAEIQTEEVSQIDLTSADVHAKLLERRTDKSTMVGFYFATHPDVTEEDSCIVVYQALQNDSVEVVYSLSHLEDGTAYYVRAFAKNNVGISFGEEKSFVTTEMLPPTVGAVKVTSISYTEASCSSQVNTDGGGEVVARGFCYSTKQDPTIEAGNISSGKGLGSYNSKILGLSAGTLYYVRAYATNKKGTAYGEQTSFTTEKYTAPSVTTLSATEISYTSANCGGEVTADGGQTVIERGICYSTSELPTISNNKVACGSGIGSFSSEIAGLTAGTTYYVRAYAINNVGTSYGNQVAVKAKDYELPKVSTNSEVTNITYNSAICSGSVSNDGGQPILERGVCYSTSKNPTIEDRKVVEGSGLGDFTCNITGLVGHYTRYYVRAFATNSVGTAYGEQVTFETATYRIPIFESHYMSIIEDSSVTFQVTIMADGGMPVTSRGFCYSKAPNPTISSSKYQCGSGIGSYTCIISGLDKGAIYYVRAYATNSIGTAYLDCGTIMLK